MKIINRQISELKSADYNPRKLNSKQFEDLKQSINTFGQMEPAIINMYTGRENIIVSGHQRLKVAKALGFTEWPCIQVDLPIQKEKELNIRMNKNTGEWDFSILEKHFELPELMEWGFDELELNFEKSPGLTGEDEVPEPPKEPVTKPGDLYILGNHKLLCGDSTNIQHVEKLMLGEKADMVFTDPPYGIGFSYNSHKDTTGDEYIDFCRDWFHNLKPLAEFIVISTGWAYNKFWYTQDPDDCFYWLSRNKRTGGSISHFRKVEPIFIWGKPKSKYDFDFFEQTTEIEEGLKGKHTCPKPVSLIEMIISKGGTLVLDVFGGSGTTMIACEKTNRKCRMMEIDPMYCDVIVKRWEAFTGKKAELTKE